MFQNQVVKFHQTNYDTKLPHLTLISASISTTDNSSVCNLCHKTLKKGKMPPQAITNNLLPGEIVDEIKALNTLERHMISPVIAFMKIINLPKGTQKGIHGPVVSVKSDVVKTATTLPRNLGDDSFIKVKLKRKLSYKGHQFYQEINPKRIFSALDVLKSKNPHFSGMYMS